MTQHIHTVLLTLILCAVLLIGWTSSGLSLGGPQGRVGRYAVLRPDEGEILDTATGEILKGNMQSGVAVVAHVNLPASSMRITRLETSFDPKLK